MERKSSFSRKSSENREKYTIEKIIIKVDFLSRKIEWRD